MKNAERKRFLWLIPVVVVIIIIIGGKIALDKYCAFPEKPLAQTDEEVMLIAHRGYSAAAPENTAAAFELAGQAGFWAAECDVYRTADGKWIIFHDPVSYRMTGGIKIIKAAKYDNLAKLTVKRGQQIESFPNEGICTFEEYLDICAKYDMTAVIELKSKGQTRHYGEITALVEQYGVNARYISFQYENLKAIRALSDAPCGYLVREIEPEDLDRALALGNCSIEFSAKKKANTDAVILGAKDAGLSLGAWTVNDPAMITRLASLGVERITTDAVTAVK